MRELTFTRRGVIRVLDSYASLLVLLLANFFLLELVDDPRWGAIGSTLLAAARAGGRDQRSRGGPQDHAPAGAADPGVRGARAARPPRQLSSLVGLTYLLPVVLLVTATLPITLSRVLRHRRVTHETVLGALCAYVLVGLLFAFLYLAVATSETARSSPSRARTCSRSTSTSASSR